MLAAALATSGRLEQTVVAVPLEESLAKVEEMLSGPLALPVEPPQRPPPPGTLVQCKVADVNHPMGHKPSIRVLTRQAELTNLERMCLLGGEAEAAAAHLLRVSVLLAFHWTQQGNPR